MSTSVDLSAHDLCWLADGDEVRIELDGFMLDSVATGYLDVPLAPDMRAWLVEPDAACGDGADGEIELSGLEFVDPSFAVLAIDPGEDEGFEGTFPTMMDGDVDDGALRGGDCSAGDYTVSTSTVTGSDGSCQTRTVLTQCRLSVYPLYGGIHGKSMEVTYDSGWLDCSDPCM